MFYDNKTIKTQPHKQRTTFFMKSIKFLIIFGQLSPPKFRPMSVEHSPTSSSQFNLAPRRKIKETHRPGPKLISACPRLYQRLRTSRGFTYCIIVSSYFKVKILIYLQRIVMWIYDGSLYIFLTDFQKSWTLLFEILWSANYTQLFWILRNVCR